jgi:hypothetical protein
LFSCELKRKQPGSVSHSINSAFGFWSLVFEKFTKTKDQKPKTIQKNEMREFTI